MPTQNAVVLLSGGLDSATTLAIAKRDGFACHTLAFNYGQRHIHELAAAETVSKSLGATSHTTLTVDLRLLGGSALTADIAVPKDRSASAMSHDIPVTYVPARNLIFLSLALAAAETRDARNLFIGVNAIDYSGYPDCRPEFIRAFQHTADLATKVGAEGGHFKIHTPLITLAKHEIISLGHTLGVNFALTHSCYDPVAADPTDHSPPTLACGTCDSCQLRRDGFAKAGIPDPTRYRPRI